MSRDVTLVVTAEDGAIVTNAVRLARPVPLTFDGRVLFQIEAGTRVRVFIMPTPDKPSDGDIPWAIPPPWQGAPTVPGLSGQE